MGMITDEQLKTMVEADAAGKAWAENLRVGEQFYGASPAAKAAEYTDLARHAFVYAALDVFENRILRTNADGILTEYRSKTPSKG